jgi:very-short-patch-repair endonuclease
MVVRALGKYGACRRRDLTAELGRSRVDSALRRGEIVQLWAGVVVDGDRAATITARAAAALVAGGPRSAIAGLTAARLHGCTAARALPAHLMVPYESWLRSLPGLVVHNGRDYESGVCNIDGLRVLALDRVIVDILATGAPGTALAIVDQALRLVPAEQRAAFRTRLHLGLADRADPRGTVSGARVLDLATGRADSPQESRLLWALVESGLPTPEVNWPIADIDGIEIRRLDLAWPDLMVALEYNGYAAHVGREAEDEARTRDLERRGWLIIPVELADMRRPTKLIAKVRSALSSRGCC